MKDLKKAIASVRRTVRAMRGVRLTISPKRDWYIILATSTLLVIIFVGVGVYQFHSARVLADTWGAGRGVAAVRAPDIEKLAEVLGAFRERTLRFEQLRLEPSPAPVLDRQRAPVDGVQEQPVETDPLEVAPESEAGNEVAPESAPPLGE